MRKATEGIDYTSRDYQAYKQLLIQKLQEKIPEYTDTSETDAGIAILESFANGLDICSYYTDSIANDLVLATTQDRKLACILASNLGYTPYYQSASVIPLVFTLEDALEEDYIIGKGTVVTTEETESEEPVYFETDEDLTIPAGHLGNEKDEKGNYIYTVLASQGETVDDDYVGSSDGSAYQSFQTAYAEVLVDTLRVYVDEGNGETLWNRVDSFLDSDKEDKVYMVIIDENDNCFIEFGNNIRGKIPTPYDNGIRCYYKTGGGEIGNVKEGTVTNLETEVAYVDSVTNLEPVILGHEKEPLEEIKYHAPAKWRTRDRAVTLEDYNDLILTNVSNYPEFYGVLNTNPLQDSSNELKVNIYYQMKKGYTFTDELQRSLDAFFSNRIIIGTSYEFFAYSPYIVNLVASVVTSSDYVRDDVITEVENYLKEEVFAYGNFTFEDELLTSDLEQKVVQNVSGVKAFRITSPTDIVIKAGNNGIITLGTVTLN